MKHSRWIGPRTYRERRPGRQGAPRAGRSRAYWFPGLVPRAVAFGPRDLAGYLAVGAGGRLAVRHGVARGRRLVGGHRPADAGRRILGVHGDREALVAEEHREPAHRLGALVDALSRLLAGCQRIGAGLIDARLVERIPEC